MDTTMLERIAGGNVRAGQKAKLEEHCVLRQANEPFPYLVKSAGAAATGLYFDALTPMQMLRLDAYETPFGYFREDVTLEVDGQSKQGFAYFPDPTVKASDALWDMNEWDASHGDLSREMADEIGSYTPPLSGDALIQQWAMIARRAAASLRAKTDAAPTSLRYAAEVGDVVISERGPLHGAFFKSGALHLNHKTFANKRTEPLVREFFAGTDASMLLPYDPVSDMVLLVEQMRVGPLVRGDANPWSLEPIAGMIDAFEEPEAAALREAKEEAGLSEIALEKMFSFYASPGSTTDYFYCFLGLCNMPEVSTYTGGLEEEAEDLRLHVLPFDDAMALLVTGEINAGPLVAMLLWIDRNRLRLRTGS